MTDQTETIDVYSSEKPHGVHEKSFFSPETNLTLLTCGTFILLLVILKKYAWKPILETLDKREEEIRASLEKVDKIHDEYSKIDQKRQEILNEAEQKAKEIIADSRKAAVEAVQTIHKKAKQENQILLENAMRTINQEKAKATSELREESARIAVQLAGKIIEENLDDEKNRRLIEKYMKEL